MQPWHAVNCAHPFPSLPSFPSFLSPFHLSPSTCFPTSQGIYSDPGCAAAGVVDHSVLVMGWRERYFWVDYKMVQEGTYSDAGCAVAGVVDHSVVVMGYSITADSAFWILRNSWGATWGMQGYMQMAFEGGVGICGIHSVPALYPIIKTDVCSLQDDNPCAVGTCINDNAGGFFCLCPPGFDQGYRPNGAYTCVPTSNPSYTVVFPIDIDCPLVYQLYGLTEEAFLAQNPNLNMDHCMTIPANTESMDHCVTIPKSTYASVLPPLMGSSMDHCVTIPKNTEVSVLPPLMGSVQCGLFYSWTANDTCKGVAGLFSLTVAGFLRLNPGINCTSKTAWNAPTVNQQLCVALGNGADLPMCTAWYTVIAGDICNGADLPMCTAWYTVKAGDTCADIMADHSLNDTTFFALNPGLGCDSLFPSVGGSLFPSFSGSGRGWSGDGVQVCVDAYIVNASGPFTPRSLRELSSTSSSPSSSSSSPSLFSTRGRRLGRQLAVSKAPCLKYYYVTKGDMCARIITLKFQNSAQKLSELNNGYVCVNSKLYVGLSLCTRR
ncbi:unnamed protein product [Closterium sp. NIES-64]|nr:unnamed protein product [Closterium sp. NIES-64]